MEEKRREGKRLREVMKTTNRKTDRHIDTITI